MQVLIIDNYDSFTFNLYHMVGDITNIAPKVVYNDQFTWQDFQSWNCSHIIISPGPGKPDRKKDFGICREIITKATIPVLGVCLGHQGIGYFSGARLVQSSEIMHGRKSEIFHVEKGLFAGIKQGFSAMRYHSFVIENNNLPSSLSITAWTSDNTVMGIKHVDKPLWGVQFHPESVGTEYGEKLIQNFLNCS